jgi:hypothetical protein
MLILPHIILISGELKDTPTMARIVITSINVIRPLTLSTGLLAAADTAWIVPFGALAACQVVRVQKILRFAL